MIHLKYSKGDMRVQCPRIGRKTMINACGACEFRGELDFGEHVVACRYSDRIKDAERTAKRKIHMLKTKHLYIWCPNAMIPEPLSVEACHQCQFNRGIAFDYTVCAFRPDFDAEAAHENQNAETTQAGSPRQTPTR